MAEFIRCPVKLGTLICSDGQVAEIACRADVPQQDGEPKVVPGLPHSWSGAIDGQRVTVSWQAQA